MGRVTSNVRNDVAAARRRVRLTQQQLGRLVGVSRQTVVEIEAGGYNPSTAVALRLAVVLDSPVESLFSLPEEELEALRTSRDDPTDSDRRA
jgi:putative transcriptional regulator